MESLQDFWNIEAKSWEFLDISWSKKKWYKCSQEIAMQKLNKSLYDYDKRKRW